MENNKINTKENKLDIFDDCIIVNDKYKIYKSDGCIYNIESDNDIPQYVFKIRDDETVKKYQYIKAPL